MPGRFVIWFPFKIFEGYSSHRCWLDAIKWLQWDVMQVQRGIVQADLLRCCPESYYVLCFAHCRELIVKDAIRLHPSLSASCK